MEKCDYCGSPYTVGPNLIDMIDEEHHFKLCDYGCAYSLCYDITCKNISRSYPDFIDNVIKHAKERKNGSV